MSYNAGVGTTYMELAAISFSDPPISRYIHSHSSNRETRGEFPVSLFTGLEFLSMPRTSDRLWFFTLYTSGFNFDFSWGTLFSEQCTHPVCFLLKRGQVHIKHCSVELLLPRVLVTHGRLSNFEQFCDCNVWEPHPPLSTLVRVSMLQRGQTCLSQNGPPQIIYIYGCFFAVSL